MNTALTNESMAHLKQQQKLSSLRESVFNEAFDRYQKMIDKCELEKGVDKKKYELDIMEFKKKSEYSEHKKRQIMESNKRFL